MHTLSKFALATAIALSSAPLAFAQDAQQGAPHAQGGQAVQGASTSTHAGGVAGQTVDGEVRKVDKEAGKISIRHGELKHLNMPAMTMVFRVKDPAMLDQVKAGDKISFVSDKIGGQFTLTQIEVTNQAQSGASH
jgi:Cu(I)/Ag(I) efflux system protein CusF